MSDYKINSLRIEIVIYICRERVYIVISDDINIYDCNKAVPGKSAAIDYVKKKGTVAGRQYPCFIRSKWVNEFRVVSGELMVNG